MSSTNSSSTEPTPPPADRRKNLGANVLLLVVTILILGALVWSLNPRQPNLTPAPLRPPPPGCIRTSTEFVPSDVTDLPGVNFSKLDKKHKYHFLLRMNMEPCPCGCNQSVAACFLSDPSCQAAKAAVQKMLAEEEASM
jgi:hypothetical protein